MITTLPELRSALEMHYGRREVVDGRIEVKPRLYDDITRRDIAAWASTYTESLQALFDQVTLDVSVNYGRLPDKAQLARAAERIKARPVYLGTTGPAVPTDDETRVVVEGLNDIVANLGQRRWKTVERRDPYVDDTLDMAVAPTKPVEKGPAIDPTLIMAIQPSPTDEGSKKTGSTIEEELPGWVL